MQQQLRRERGAEKRDEDGGAGMKGERWGVSKEKKRMMAIRERERKRENERERVGGG